MVGWFGVGAHTGLGIPARREGQLASPDNSILPQWFKTRDRNCAHSQVINLQPLFCDPNHEPQKPGPRPQRSFLHRLGYKKKKKVYFVLLLRN